MTLQKSSAEILNQLVQLIDQLSEKQYTEKLQSFSGSTVGKHVRHVVEFYECMFKGLQTGTVNYDNRTRNLIIETDPFFTVQLLLDIIQKVNSLNYDKTMRLKIDLSNGAGETEIRTNYFRELAYNVEHAIHHMAIIKIGVMTYFPEVNLDNNFGVAYSTIRHKEQEKIKVLQN